MKITCKKVKSKYLVLLFLNLELKKNNESLMHCRLGLYDEK